MEGDNGSKPLCDLCARDYGVCQYEVLNGKCNGFISPEELKRKINNGHQIYPKSKITFYKVIGIVSPVIAIIIFIWGLASGVFSSEAKRFTTIEKRVETENHIINRGEFKHFTDEQVNQLNKNLWELAYQVGELNKQNKKNEQK